MRRLRCSTVLVSMLVAAGASSLLPQGPPTQPVAEAPAHVEPVGQVAYDASGQWLVSMDPTTVKTWSVNDGKRVGLAAIEGGVSLLRTSPTDPLVAFLRKDESVELRTLPALKPVRSWPTGNEYGTSDLAFTHDGASLATCAYMGAHSGVRFWDTGTGGPTRESGLRCDHIAFSPDGRWMATARLNGSRPEIKLWQLSDLTPVRTWTPYPEGTYFSLAFASASNLLVAGWRAPTTGWERKKDQYSYWRVPSGEQQIEASGPSGVETIALGAGTLLSAAGGTVRLWKLPNETEPLAFEPRGLEFEAHAGPVQALAPSPDGATFATAGRDRAVRIWRLGDGSRVRELADPAGAPKPTAPVRVASTAPPKASPVGPAPAGPQAGVVVTGRLVSASGRPVARRNLKLPLADPDEAGGLFYAFAPDFYEATTGDDGRFRFAAIKAGERYALVDLSGGRPSPLRRLDGSIVLLEIAKGAGNIDLGEIRFESP